MSARLESIRKKVEKLTTAFEKQKKTEQSGNPAKTYEKTQNWIQRCIQKMKQFTSAEQNASSAAGKISSAWSNVGSLIKGVLGLATLQKIGSFVSDTMDLFNTQNQAETQIAVVGGNQGMSGTQIDGIRNHASVLQGRTIFGDETLIAGAAEISTYISDPEAVQSMMGTLTNYAAGMGGISADVQQMTEYATQLGKALDGTYDGLTKKGFVLTDQQKEIIENGTDMQKALVLDDVIAQSWAGLAEAYAATPKGVVQQMANEWGDMQEVIGGRLTPSVLELLTAVQSLMRSGAASSFIDGVVTGLNLVITGLARIVNGIEQASEWIQANWALVQPILTAIGTVLLAVILVKILSLAAAWAVANAPVLIAIGLISALLFWMQSLGYSGTEVFSALAGGVNVVIQFFKNLGLAIADAALGSWNVLKALANNMQAAFHNSIAAIQGFFYSLLSTALTVVGKIAAELNKLPFISFDYSGITDAASDYADKAAAAYGSRQEYTSLWDAWKSGATTHNAFSDGWVSDAYESGASWGTNTAHKLGNLVDTLSNQSWVGDAAFGTSVDIDDVASVGDVGSVGKIDDDVSIDDEDLKFLKDYNEMKYVQNFVTLTPTVAVDAKISEKVDADEVIREIETKLEDEFEAAAAGVYA